MSVVVCARCGHASRLDSWLARPARRTITPAELAGQVSAWPDGAVIEVRACTGCGGDVARLRAHAARIHAVLGAAAAHGLAASSDAASSRSNRSCP